MPFLEKLGQGSADYNADGIGDTKEKSHACRSAVSSILAPPLYVTIVICDGSAHNI